MTQHRFDGHVLMYTDNPALQQKVVGLTLRADFAPHGGWTVQPADFGNAGIVVVPDVNYLGGLVQLEVSLAGPAQGTFDPTTGHTSVQGKFRFAIAVLAPTLTLAYDSSQTCRLSEHTVLRGHPYDRGRNQVSMTAISPFAGAPLAGINCLCQLVGGWTPPLPGTPAPAAEG